MTAPHGRGVTAAAIVALAATMLALVLGHSYLEAIEWEAFRTLNKCTVVRQIEQGIPWRTRTEWRCQAGQLVIR